jgi:hypothetical protein
MAVSTGDGAPPLGRFEMIAKTLAEQAIDDLGAARLSGTREFRVCPRRDGGGGFRFGFRGRLTEVSDPGLTANDEASAVYGVAGQERIEHRSS